METVSEVKKEEVNRLHFSGREVLKSFEDRVKRRADLYRAMILGNMEHVKARIYFETDEGVKQVETTVWATTDTEVSLKGGVCIPLNSIYRVSF